jgi:hypothetical protein
VSSASFAREEYRGNLISCALPHPKKARRPRQPLTGKNKGTALRDPFSLELPYLLARTSGILAHVPHIHVKPNQKQSKVAQHCGPDDRFVQFS